MLRRFEIYKVRSDVPSDLVDKFETALRDCGRYIPEVLHSVVGRNLSQASVTHVWEHGYASPESYQRYMQHPYHACILDRYLLHDNPERITEDNRLRGGLLGYEIEEPEYYMAGGVRRLVLLALAGDASGEQTLQLLETLRQTPRDAPEMTLSVVGENTMGAAWRTAYWTHLWEQGFESLEAMEAYRAGASPLAREERAGWKERFGGIVTDAADVYYELHEPV